MHRTFLMNAHCFFRTGGERDVVVLLLEGDRVHGHRADGAEEEEPTDHVPSRLPPRHHAQHLVVGDHLHPWRTL